jgi:hypothetical protein
MAYGGGAITVERTWRQKERMSLIKRRKPEWWENIKIALNDGWVITYKELQNLLSLFVKGQHI